MQVTRSLFVVSILLFFSACGSGPTNQAQQQAVEIHNKLVADYDALYQNVEEKIAVIKAEEQTVDGAEAKSAYASMIRGLDKALVSLDQWKSNLTEVEGGNNFTKGTTTLRSNEGISDRDNLQIQQDMKRRFKEIKDQIEELFTTIDQYKKQHA